MKVKVLYFAQVAEKVGISAEEVEITEGANSDDLLQLLAQKYPVIEGLTFNLAVNQSLIRDSVPLSNNVEVALLPPFAGG